MKQEFVTVGRWTLRCDDVSGVSAAQNPELGAHGWTVSVMTRGGLIEIDTNRGAADASGIEVAILEAIGAMVTE
jgi:hypothetical protein